jgi:hypothetical protein
MSEGPLFPKKTDPDAPEETTGSQVEIERSDDPNFGKSTSSTGRRVPSVPGRPAGCSSQVFLLMLMGVALMVAARVLL